MVIFLAAVLTFAGTLGFDYTWDDPPLVTRVQEALSGGKVSQLFTTSFFVQTVQSARYFRPVMMGSLLGDVVLTGGSPWFSHLVNVLIHGINAVLVFFLFNLILGSRPGALAGALLFAVHPVHAEAVSAVSSRMDLMALMFILPAAILWVSPAEDRQERVLLSWMAAALSFLLACFTKETAFMLPAALVGWEALRWRRPNRQQVVGAVFLAASAGGALLARAAVFAREADNGVRTVKAGALWPDANFWTSLKILLVNMRLAVYPFPIRSHWAGSDLVLGGTTFLGAALFIAAVGAAFRKRRHIAAMGITWWAVFTFPVLGFFNLGQVVAAERYAYIPSAGICLIAGILAAGLAEKQRKRMAVKKLLTAGVFLLASWTVFHTLPWTDEVRIYRHVLGSNPAYATPYLNLGVVLAREGQYEEAMEAYNSALELVPGWDKALFNRGNLSSRMGRSAEALADFEKLLDLKPDDWEAALNMGNVLAALGRTGEAVSSYERAAVSGPSSGMPLVALALISAGKGDHGEAARLFGEAAAREPDLSVAYEGLGESYMAMGKPDLAQGALLKA
ncbi:MAG: tetratricopeptide repeat protein, partial [bacterium]|nr:tetratricopeptide repeat protein [bacterium]